jgi:hypothetical protein
VKHLDAANWGRPSGDAMIFTCLARHVKRYDSLLASCEPQTDELRAWFKLRYDYLHYEWIKAVNASDSIIGKQWHYDCYHKQIAWGDR